MKTQSLVAEFFGTFFLCFAGIAAILSATPTVGSGAGIVGIALAHGLAFSVAVNASGGVSGAHFNPAVSIPAFAIGCLPLSGLRPYIARFRPIGHPVKIGGFGIGLTVALPAHVPRASFTNG